MKQSNSKFILLTIFFLLALIIGWYFFIRDKEPTPSSSDSVKSSSQATLDEVPVGRTFTLPGLNPQNTQEQKDTIDMSVVQARKLNQVQVKGEPVFTPEGKVFLAIDLELSNASQEGLGFFSRDYFRLLLDNKPFAPQFYNRGVAVAPVSVKNDRVAFLVDADLKVFEVQIGELQGEKEILELQFQK